MIDDQRKAVTSEAAVAENWGQRGCEKGGVRNGWVDEEWPERVKGEGPRCRVTAAAGKTEGGCEGPQETF